MEEQLRILGFKNYPNRNGAPLVIVLVSEDRKLTNVFPDGDKMSLGDVSEESITMFGFIPGSGYPDKLDVWQEGQIAYLDLGGKVHVGPRQDVLPLLSVDLLNVEDDFHRQLLKEILDEEGAKQ